jgi:hypothetical protein
MRAGPLALTLGATAVALGGVYLLWELRSGGAAAPTSIASTEKPRARPAEDRGAGEPRGAAEPRPVAARPTPTAPKRGPMSDVASPLGAAPSGEPSPPPPPPPPVETTDRLLEANKLYDRGDYDGARQLAIKLLSEAPGNVKLLRVVVSSACILGDPEMAPDQYVAAAAAPRPQIRWPIAAPSSRSRSSSRRRGAARSTAIRARDEDGPARHLPTGAGLGTFRGRKDLHAHTGRTHRRRASPREGHRGLLPP